MLPLFVNWHLLVSVLCLCPRPLRACCRVPKFKTGASMSDCLLGDSGVTDLARVLLHNTTVESLDLTSKAWTGVVGWRVFIRLAQATQF